MEFEPKDIENLKTQIKEDLQMTVNRFNNDLSAWEARSKSFANFRWVYDEASGCKRLAIQSIDLPVARLEAAEEDIEIARGILSEASVPAANP